MILGNPSDLRAALAPGRRLMGLDLGDKTIGLAISDAGLVIASPLLTIRRRKFTADAAELAELVRKHDVGGLILGLPVALDGTEGPRCQSVRQFARNLAGPLPDLDIAFWDERMSTAAVNRMLIDEMDTTRKRRAEIVDKLAAAYILQGALDSLRAR